MPHAKASDCAPTLSDILDPRAPLPRTERDRREWAKEFAAASLAAGFPVSLVLARMDLVLRLGRYKAAWSALAVLERALVAATRRCDEARAQAERLADEFVECATVYARELDALPSPEKPVYLADLDPKNVLVVSEEYSGDASAVGHAGATAAWCQRCGGTGIVNDLVCPDCVPSVPSPRAACDASSGAGENTNVDAGVR